MFMKWIAVPLFILSAVFFTTAPVSAEYIVNLQGAAVFTGERTTSASRDSGTKFSLTDDLSADTEYTGRLEAGYIHKERDYFGIVIAPLSVDSHGRLDRDISYAGTTFPAGTDLDATFRFDSYRVTWRRKLVSKETLDVWLGLSGNIRDASITVEGGGQRGRRRTPDSCRSSTSLWTGGSPSPVVPRRRGRARGPQGRAEDVLFALLYDINDATKVFAG